MSNETRTVFQRKRTLTRGDCPPDGEVKTLARPTSATTTGIVERMTAIQIGRATAMVAIRADARTVSTASSIRPVSASTEITN